MAVVATDQCTLAVSVDVESVQTWYMQVAASESAPAKPTVADPTSLGWATSEPGFDAANSKKLYTCQKTTLTDGTFMWGAVQLSSSYTGASTALNTANAAATAASNAEKVATNYITALSGNGIWVTPSDAKPSAQGAATATTSGWHISDAIELFRLGVSHIKMWVENSVAKLRLGAANSTHVMIDADSLDIEDGSSNVLATFGASGAQIGLTDESHMGLDYHSMQMVDSDDVTYMHVSDLRDRMGYATITEVLPFNDPYIELSFTTEHSLVESITLDDGTYVVTSFSTTTMEYDPEYGSMLPWDITRITVVSYEYAIDPGDDMTLAVDPSTATVTYKTNNTRTKTFTLGTRKSGTVTGPYSYALGSEVEASGTASHAEGVNTRATGVASHAEGFDTLASEYLSHAEGGSCQAIGPYSHAEGAGTVAVEAYSHAEGSGTIANDLAQTAIGRYNVRTSSRAFVIGNGTGDGNRSNALTVDWSGNVVAAGNLGVKNTITLGTHTTAEENGIRLWGGGTRSAWVLRTINAANGDGDAVLLGDGGMTIVGGGESAANLWTALGVSAGTEQLHLASDTSIHLHANCQTVANRQTVDITANGSIIGPNNHVVKLAGVDSSASDNGVSAATYRYHSFLDESDRYIGWLGTTVATNGNITTTMAARTRNGSANLDNVLSLGVTKSGTRTVSVSESAPWRSALGLGTAATHADTDYADATHSHSEYFSSTVNRTANTVLAAPNGSAGHASFRKLVAADLPDCWTGSKGDTSYWGLVNPDGGSTGWVRTTANGLLPAASGGGSSSLGTSTWPFTNLYATNVYSNGTKLGLDYYAASSATNVTVANTSLYRFLVILFRTNSATYTGGGTSAATSPLNSTVVHINKKSSGSVYVSLLGGHALSASSVQIRTGLATVTCSATAGKVTLSNQRYINLGNGSSGTQEVGTQTDMALVGVVGIY